MRSLIPDRAVPVVLLKWHNVSSLQQNDVNSSLEFLLIFYEFVSALVCTKNYQKVPHSLNNSPVNEHSLFLFFLNLERVASYTDSLWAHHARSWGRVDHVKSPANVCVGLRRPSSYSYHFLQSWSYASLGIQLHNTKSLPCLLLIVSD